MSSIGSTPILVPGSYRVPGIAATERSRARRQERVGIRADPFFRSVHYGVGPASSRFLSWSWGGTTQVVGVEGGPFVGITGRLGFTTATGGVFTGTIGFNGTIIGQNDPFTIAGVGIPVTGQGIPRRSAFR
jgi:hypothetical protein